MIILQITRTRRIVYHLRLMMRRIVLVINVTGDVWFISPPEGYVMSDIDEKQISDD
jgi:hypothetical protein